MKTFHLASSKNGQVQFLVVIFILEFKNAGHLIAWYLVLDGFIFFMTQPVMFLPVSLEIH